MEVELVRWPEEEARRQVLREEHLPRLLLVSDGSPPDCGDDLLEDWIRVPADERDVCARVNRLRLRAESESVEVPTLDSDGVLHLGGDWVSVPPVEARLLAVLLEQHGVVVSREALNAIGWPDGTPRSSSLYVHVLRLRRRIAPLGLSIITVRSRGYLLKV